MTTTAGTDPNRTIVKTYYYAYGAGNPVNRAIQFIRPAEHHTIYANVYAITPGRRFDFISTVAGSEIEVNMKCLSYKLAEYERLKFNAREKLSDLPRSLQNTVLLTLQPQGSKEITVTVDPKQKFESVTHLEIFDPNQAS